MSVKCKLQLSQTVIHSYEERQHIFNYLTVEYCDLLFFTLLSVGFLTAVSVCDNPYYTESVGKSGLCNISALELFITLALRHIKCSFRQVKLPPFCLAEAH